MRPSTAPVYVMLRDWRSWCSGGHGGYARAQSQTPAQRSALGRYAVAVRDGRPLPQLDLSDTPASVFRRALRALARRQAAHDGVKYVDSMSWQPRVVEQVCADLGLEYRPRRPRA